MTISTPVSPSNGFPRLLNTLSRSRTRYALYALAAAFFVILTIFPRYHVAQAKMVNQDSNIGGLSAQLGMLGGAGLQNFASFLGTHQSAETYLLIGRSNEVATTVVKQLRLARIDNPADMARAKVRLSKKIDIHTLNGGVLEVEVKDRDPETALRMVSAYKLAIEQRVRDLSRRATTDKKAIIADQYAEASVRLTTAQAELERFRRNNNLAEPGAQFGAQVGARTTLEAQLRAKELQLRTLRQFNTDQSIEVKTVIAEMGGIRSQLAQADSTAQSGLQSLASKTVEYLNIYREERFAEALFEIYKRSLEQVSVQEIIVESNQDFSTLEEPNVDPKRRLNAFGYVPLFIVLLLAFYFEYYVPATGLARRRRVA